MEPLPRTINIDGDYTLDDVLAGHEYLFTLKGEFEGATATLEFFNDSLGEYQDVEGGSWSDEMETRLVAPGSRAKLSVSGSTPLTRIGVTLTPLRI